MKSAILRFLVDCRDPAIVQPPDKRQAVQIYLACLTVWLVMLFLIPDFSGAFVLRLLPVMFGLNELREAFGRKGWYVGLVALMAAGWITFMVRGGFHR